MWTFTSRLIGHSTTSQSIGVNNSISPVVSILEEMPSGRISVCTMFCTGGVGDAITGCLIMDIPTVKRKNCFSQMWAPMLQNFSTG